MFGLLVGSLNKIEGSWRNFQELGEKSPEFSACEVHHGQLQLLLAEGKRAWQDKVERCPRDFKVK